MQGVARYCPLLHRTVLASDDTASEVVNLGVNIVTSLAAVCGNLVLMLSIWNTPSLHSPSHVLLFGLAIADFGVGLLAQPAFMVYFIAKLLHRPDLICRSGVLVSSLSFGLAGISFFTLTAISLDRFLALRLHLRYRTIVTTERVLCCLAVIWVAGIVVATLGPLLRDGFEAVIIISDVVASVCIPLMALWYASIYRVMRRHQRQIQNGQTPNSLSMAELRKSSLVRFFSCCLFLLCYVPFVFVTVRRRIVDGSVLARQVAYELSSTVILAGSCLNPLLYYWRLRAMRIAFRQTLRRYCC